jgi:anti-anti-sigma factor
MDYVKTEIKGKVLRLEYLREDLVFNTASFMLEYIEKMLNSTNADKLVLDLINVNQIDSSAVGMFIALKYEMNKRKKKFKLAGLSDNVRRTLYMLDIDNFLGAA